MRSDALVRTAAAIEILAVGANLVGASILGASLLGVSVGILWFGLVALLIVQSIGVGALLVRGHHRACVASPVFGIAASLCCFNLVSLSVELVALAMMFAASVLREREDAAGQPA